MPNPAFLADLLDMALIRARVARYRGEWDDARDNLGVVYWCRGMLRQVAPRPHRVGAL